MSGLGDSDTGTLHETEPEPASLILQDVENLWGMNSRVEQSSYSFTCHEEAGFGTDTFL